MKAVNNYIIIKPIKEEPKEEKKEEAPKEEEKKEEEEKKMIKWLKAVEPDTFLVVE